MAAYLVESELPRLTVEQDGQEHTVSLRTTPKTDVDLKLLATLLSREDYERVVAYKVSHTVAVKSEPLATPDFRVAVNDGILYGKDMNTGKIYTVDPKDGTAIELPVADSIQSPGACDCAGILYGDGHHDDFCASRKPLTPIT